MLASIRKIELFSDDPRLAHVKEMNAAIKKEKNDLFFFEVHTRAPMKVGKGTMEKEGSNALLILEKGSQKNTMIHLYILIGHRRKTTEKHLRMKLEGSLTIHRGLTT